MADNTNDDTLDNSTNAQSKNPSDDITPANDKEAISKNQETENMEVHHHAHHPAAPHHKKNWKSYFWEFLMLFLAVFCGFLAESYHVHLVNNGIEKRNIKLVIDNLKDDTAKLKYCIRANEQSIKWLDTLISFRNLQNTDTLYSNTFNNLFMKVIPNYTFFSNTAAIDQMKFSGSLRLVKNEEVLSGIFKYEGMNEFLSINRANIATRSEQMIENASTFLNMQDVASNAGVQFLQDSQIKSPKHIANSQQNIFKFFNDVIIRKATLEIIWIPQMHEQQENAEILIELLEKEYNMKDE